MKSLFHNEEKLIYYILWFICIGNILMDGFAFGQVPVGRTGRQLSSSEISSYENRKALEAYQKRNAEIDLPTQDDVIPYDKNAALLYYQAFLLLTDPNEAFQAKITDVCRGVKPDTSMRIFLGQCVLTLEMAKIASRMSDCTWGTWPEHDRIRTGLSPKLYNLRRIISVDALTLASDGHYHAALDQCLMLRRIARHISEDPILDIFTTSYDTQALNTIRHILNEMPLNADTLSWLQGQLALVQVVPSSLEREIHRNFRLTIERVQSDSITILRGMLLKRASDDQAKKRLRDLTDAQIRHEAIQTVQSLFGSVFAILHSNMSAEQKRAELKEVNPWRPTDTEASKLGPDIYRKFGLDISMLIGSGGSRMTEEQKRPLLQKMIDKLAEPEAFRLLTRYSQALGKKIDFGFLTDPEMTNTHKLADLKEVTCQLSEASAIESSTFGLVWELEDGQFESQVWHTALVNNIRAAVGIYLIFAKTGRLPEKLPEHLPKDPFTGEDFIYRITDEGFVLDYGAENIPDYIIRKNGYKIQAH
jgi:hypothetical protein